MIAAKDTFYEQYAERLQGALRDIPVDAVSKLAAALLVALREGHRVFLAGNGGSAANAMHLANDFLYGIGKDTGTGVRAEALPANASVITCLANDMSYDEIFAEQLRVKGEEGDLLVVLSGSGNSRNVVRAIEAAHARGMKTFAILGFSGGQCKDIVQSPIHFKIDDMQIAEDIQLIVGHMCMQWVRRQLDAQRGLGA